jgi:hypothetical protein
VTSFYNNLSPEDVATLDQLARLLVELREGREALLARYGVNNENVLLEKINAGELAEHPTYEDYLGAKAIRSAGMAIRADLRDYMLGIK